MILRTNKGRYLISGAVVALVMMLYNAITSDYFSIKSALLTAVFVWVFFSGFMLFLDKHHENKAYYCRHKVESAQDVICQGSAINSKSIFGTSGWMFLGNTSLDYYKIGAASGEKIIEINLSDIVSTSVFMNLLTINTDDQSFAFNVGQPKEWKNQIDQAAQRVNIDQAAQRVNLTQSAPRSDVDNTQELIKFKELLDMGAITQEEFDAKKKQLLGL